jgi:hypothetical protein
MHILFAMDSLYGESEDGFINNEEYVERIMESGSRT